MAEIPDPASGGGLFVSLKTLLVALLETGRTRLFLLANELQEEKRHLVCLAFLVLGVAFCLGMALFIGVVFLTALFWESRVPILGVLGLAFTLSGLLLLLWLKRALSRPHRIFEASLSELREDICQLDETRRANAD